MRIILKQFIFFFLIFKVHATETNEKKDLISSSSNTQCMDSRGSLELGSATTKVLIAMVNTCINKIQKIIWSKEYRIDFKEDIEKQNKLTGTYQFSPEIQFELEKYLAEIINEFSKHNVATEKMKSVATAAFRQSTNAKDVIFNIAEKFKIQIQILNQDQEAWLGYYTALQSLSTEELAQIKEKPLIIWDIGGGSQQISIKKPEQKTIESFKGDLASVGYKNLVVEKVLKKNPSEVASPNPIGLEHMNYLISLSENHALKIVPAWIKDISEKAIVVGIGGVLSKNIPEQVYRNQESAQTNEINENQILNIIPEQLEKTDDQVGLKYANTSVTNLNLVLGYMKALGISKYKVSLSNNTIGLVTEPFYSK